MLPEFSLAVQYATPAPELPRWRLRRWVQHAVKGVFTSASDPVAVSLAEDVNSVYLTLRLVDAQEGQELNQEFRQRDYATNILTFEYGADPSGALHADLVLCVPVLQREAQEQNKPLLSHAAHLTIHGTLHALGYDHINADDALQMEALETSLLDHLGIANPYLT